MPRPISDPRTMFEQGVLNMVETWLSEPDTFASIAEKAGYQPAGAGGAAQIITVDREGIEVGKVDTPHPRLELVLSVSQRSGVYLHGPKGSGKSTIAQQVAQAMGLPCYVQGRVEMAPEVFGFRDARGEYRETPFRKAFKEGGVYCLDEMDRSDQSALTALNDALSSRRATFPDGVTVTAHDKFRFISTGNTAGRGEEAGYSAAVEHDSAVLDRLAFIRVDYDEAFERSLIPARFSYWADRVFSLRKAISEIGASVDATPRATITGAALLHDGIKQSDVEEALIWKGLDAETRDQISRRAAAIGEED